MARASASADVFHAIADPTRRAILDALCEGELSVAELAGPHTMSLPAVSQHLAVLRRAGLVRERREGRSRLYRIEPAPLDELRDWMMHYRRFWPQRLDALGDVLAAERARSETPKPSRSKGARRAE